MYLLKYPCLESTCSKLSFTPLKHAMTGTLYPLLSCDVTRRGGTGGGSRDRRAELTDDRLVENSRRRYRTDTRLEGHVTSRHVEWVRGIDSSLADRLGKGTVAGQVITSGIAHPVEIGVDSHVAGI